jgi:hypothetical protein
VESIFLQVCLGVTLFHQHIANALQLHHHCMPGGDADAVFFTTTHVWQAAMHQVMQKRNCFCYFEARSVLSWWVNTLQLRSCPLSWNNHVWQLCCLSAWKVPLSGSS